jgi:hypothetical protein
MTQWMRGLVGDMGFTNPDAPVTEAEYLSMKEDAVELQRLVEALGNLPLNDLEREDRAFLVYEIDKYETEHRFQVHTFDSEFVTAEMKWWHR